MEGKEDLDTLTTSKLLNQIRQRIFLEASWHERALIHTDKLSCPPNHGGHIQNIYWRWCLTWVNTQAVLWYWPNSMSGRALAVLNQNHARDQFSGMDGFGPMPCWSCLVYLMSQGNLSNSARSQQETPSGLINQKLLRSIIIRLFSSFTFGFFSLCYFLPNEHWKFLKSHRVIKLGGCLCKTCWFWTTKRFLTQAELL